MDIENTKLEWTKEAVLDMIYLWQSYECLYNPKNKFYHNKHSRYSAFSAIADKLKIYNDTIGPNDVKNKMQYLRGQYTRELAKSKEMKRFGSEDTYVPNAYWFSEMSFLQDFVKSRKDMYNFYEQNTSQLEDSCESSQHADNDVYPSTQPAKRIKLEDPIAEPNHNISKEDDVLEAAVNILNDLKTDNSSVSHDRNEAFCNFIKAELASIKSENIRDEFIETITLSLFEAKRKQRQLLKKLDDSDISSA
ncbi:uncharacterized protein LOC101897842 isoform X2 [Musca domestica]|uniref:Uncharacterized protein LOC101897842 n=1 Tax=Musca domestica TaxID=7370 RepID=A0A1I8N3W5_MUSDO|nr:uncharacterized protein LOC101897842 isoform X2 [Musca domestica]